MAESGIGRPLLVAGGPRRGHDSRGEVTAEYAVVMLAGVCFAGVLFQIIGGPINGVDHPVVRWLRRFLEWLFQIIQQMWRGR